MNGHFQNTVHLVPHYSLLLSIIYFYNVLVYFLESSLVMYLQKSFDFPIYFTINLRILSSLALHVRL